MNKSLFECVHERSGERLVQGLLLFLLQSDEAFRSAFLRWLGWPNASVAIQEEYIDGCHRHDLLFTFPEGIRKTLELKLWAGWTDAQSTDPCNIDCVLVPRLREPDSIAVFSAAKVRTWEALLQDVAVHSPMAMQLLRGFDEYTWTGQIFHRADLIAEIERWWRSGEDADPYRGSVFLQHCSARAKELGLDSTAASQLYRQKDYGYWGRYLINKNFEHWRQRLWFGFVFRMKGTEVRQVEFAMQALSADIGRGIGLSSELPDWYPWALSPAIGIILELNSDDCYNADDWWHACASSLAEYARITNIGRAKAR